ncbi:hypothetical protein FC91_GL001749 [Schleiferilactobacillus harbinensis DSM 16991]|uniref:Uncharacterized protein n=1 Tax=Schleiferilactobacillus harbinensis DSM 16991 TaxID=1122147 RepID=A0A0R1XG16_9LACO|nr:hypothetical protein FC91_GL001749 [Schleiferilactobacillus harbinensis DSM 16991]
MQRTVQENIQTALTHGDTRFFQRVVGDASPTNTYLRQLLKKKPLTIQVNGENDDADQFNHNAGHIHYFDATINGRPIMLQLTRNWTPWPQYHLVQIEYAGSRIK